jgi:hypothetical protein
MIIKDVPREVAYPSSTRNQRLTVEFIPPSYPPLAQATSMQRGTPAKRTRKPAVTDLQEIRFGRKSGAIYRRSDIANSSFFFRTHLKQERRYYRKSLETTDRAEALERAEKTMWEVLTKVDSGQPVMANAMDLGEAVSAFSKHLANEVEIGQLRTRTEEMQRYRVQTGLKFLKAKYPNGLRTKLSDIDGVVFKDYLRWRQSALAEKKRTIRRSVVRDELLVIRKMFKYCFREQICSERQIPKWDFLPEKEPPKRRRITYEEVDRFWKITSDWAVEAEPDSAEDYHRRIVYHASDLVRQSGLRSGELFGLLNKNAKPLNERELEICVRADTSKVGRERSIIVDCPFSIEFWLERYQRYRKPDEYLFSPHKCGTTSARDVFYHSYSSLRVALKELNRIDLYHWRHWYITERLLAGEQVHDIAKATGTSITQIEKTYSHVRTEQVTRRFNLTDIKHNRDGGVTLKRYAKTRKKWTKFD